MSTASNEEKNHNKNDKSHYGFPTTGVGGLFRVLTDASIHLLRTSSGGAGNFATLKNPCMASIAICFFCVLVDPANCCSTNSTALSANGAREALVSAGMCTLTR